MNMKSYGDKTDTYTLFILESLGFIYLNTGRLEQARQIAQLQVQGQSAADLPLMKSWGDWFLGVVCYQRNELEAAAQHFTQIFENRYISPDISLSRRRGGSGVDPSDQRGERRGLADGGVDQPV